MIKYEGTENKYFYNPERLEEILHSIEKIEQYGCLTQENVSEFVDAVNSFMSSIELKEQKSILERHETEEEAREYFGQEFIDKFDKLLTILEQQKTVVKLHGTNVDLCPDICENGLYYRSPKICYTTFEQDMAYGQHEIHCSNYKSLLNWPHRKYKGLVIIAIPYECYYKEGLWNHFQETNFAAYDGQDYRIDPDFIVGYLDVENKKIVMNPKYNRHHNYEGYVKDWGIYREQPAMNNDKFAQLVIESTKKLEAESNESFSNQTGEQKLEKKDEEIGEKKIWIRIQYLKREFDSIKSVFPENMSEKRYRSLLEELSREFNGIQKSLPTLKTNEQVKKEQEVRFSDADSIMSTEDMDIDELFEHFELF